MLGGSLYQNADAVELGLDVGQVDSTADGIRVPTETRVTSIIAADE